MAAAPTRNNTTMAVLWESWASLMTRNPFSESILTASTDVVKRIVLSQFHKLNYGTLVIHDIDGLKHVFGAPAADETLSGVAKGSVSASKPAPDVELHIHSSAVWTRILFAHDVGFAEAYMLGEISCTDLASFFRLCILNVAAFPRSTILSSLTSAVAAPLYRLSNTTEQALLNAQSHYSLSNEMFAAFLDPTMTYSAPLWLPVSDSGAMIDTLEAAQLRKLQYTVAAARIKASDHVLEIGSGWGSFAIEAVRCAGCRVTTITPSAEQASLARERIRESGFEHDIEVLVCDYRQVPLPANGSGRYDKIVSIEMIEHVGASYLDTFFACVDRYLKDDGGIAVFQVITMPEGRYEAYKGKMDFIQRYIFPGGHLPTVSGLVASIDRASKGRLVVEEVRSVSGHYVRALREWRENFLEKWDSVIKPALKERKPSMTDMDMDVFKRKWEYYFSYCRAGFATKTLGDVSITAGREGAMALIDDIPV